MIHGDRHSLYDGFPHSFVDRFFDAVVAVVDAIVDKGVVAPCVAYSMIHILLAANAATAVTITSTKATNLAMQVNIPLKLLLTIV